MRINTHAPPHKNEFFWNERNTDEVEKHGLRRRDVEHVVHFAKHPFPMRYTGRSAWRVVGKTPTYRRIEVIYFIGRDKLIHVFHAM